jgi:hypothetical protein
VGINTLPHAVRELTELGLGDRLAQLGVPTRELIYTNRFGQRIWQEDRRAVTPATTGRSTRSTAASCRC